MSNAIKMKTEKKQPKTIVAQSVPSDFYKGYQPPRSPKINPVPSGLLPDFEALPKISSLGKNINLKQTGHSFSLRQNQQYPMSMPTKHGLMGPSITPFSVNPRTQTDKNNENEEEKSEPNSLKEKNKQLKVGSFTCFDIMTGPLKQLPEAPDQKDNVSATSQQTASTFASGGFDEEAPDASEDEEPHFDMEL